MKCAILLVAYGTNSRQGQSSLSHFDARVRTQFPGWTIRWAFSSHLLRERLARAKCKSDSVIKALEKLCFENYDTILVQPLQTIAGREHGQILESVAQTARERGLDIRVGAPLLATDVDIELVARALLTHLPAERREREDVVLMGHGGRHAGCASYEMLADVVHRCDPNVHVGAMGGKLRLECLLPMLQSKRVWLMPLLATIGRHALEDMAGEGEHSWRSQLVAAGHECIPVLKGTVEYDGVAQIWLDHLKILAEDTAKWRLLDENRK